MPFSWSAIGERLNGEIKVLISISSGPVKEMCKHSWRCLYRPVVLTLFLVATSISLLDASVQLQVAAFSASAVLNSCSPLSHIALNKADLTSRIESHYKCLYCLHYLQG